MEKAHPPASGRPAITSGGSISATWRKHQEVEAPGPHHLSTFTLHHSPDSSHIGHPLHPSRCLTQVPWALHSCSPGSAEAPSRATPGACVNQGLMHPKAASFAFPKGKWPSFLALWSTALRWFSIAPKTPRKMSPDCPSNALSLRAGFLGPWSPHATPSRSSRNHLPEEEEVWVLVSGSASGSSRRVRISACFPPLDPQYTCRHP